MTTIAVIGMGQMGAAVAGRLAERGARVLTSLEGRSEASASRAAAAHAEAVDDETLVTTAGIVLSIVPPDQAEAVAARFVPLAARTELPPLFLDCNAVAPETVAAIARPFLARRLPFGDASILGGPPRPDTAGPRLYMSGPVAAAAGTLRDFGLDTRLLSASLGEASALKMAYAGITKGFQAIGAAMALGAYRHGVGDSLVEELAQSQPHLYAFLARQLPKMYAKAYRFDGEMREIAAFLQPEEAASQMFAGAADLYARIAEAHRAGPQSEIVTTLDAFAESGRVDT